MVNEGRNAKYPKNKVNKVAIILQMAQIIHKYFHIRPVLPDRRGGWIGSIDFLVLCFLCFLDVIVRLNTMRLPPQRY
jgi:hypothetical protein